MMTDKVKFNNVSVYQLLGSMREYVAVHDDHIIEALRAAMYTQGDKDSYIVSATSIRNAVADMNAMDVLTLRNILHAMQEDAAGSAGRFRSDESTVLYVALVGAVYEQIMPF